ncbi:hypothetical protein ABU162_00360 [Paenibacillus thiaminolyticus]|uniref:hypothetical protein n=1 Tax=Paenibacillus thiaminolyticus TaxID=49283 RepID=UPI0035A7314C
MFRTLDAGWGLERRTEPGQPRKKVTERKPSRQCPHFGHALVGPVYIGGARPGQTLEMKLHEIVPGSWGWTSAGGFPSYWNEKLGMTGVPEVTLDFALDADRMVGRSQFGNFDYAIGLKPFMGVMGMPPPEPGQHTTFVPRPFGGNIDCKELQAGSALHCPALIIRGGTQGAALSAEAAEQYREKLPQAEIVVFEESDHNIFEPDPNVFIHAAERFMSGLRPDSNDKKGVDIG